MYEGKNEVWKMIERMGRGRGKERRRVEGEGS